jgi:hypothetical protein
MYQAYAKIIEVTNGIDKKQNKLKAIKTLINYKKNQKMQVGFNCLKFNSFNKKILIHFAIRIWNATLKMRKSMLLYSLHKLMNQVDHRRKSTSLNEIVSR